MVVVAWLIVLCWREMLRRGLVQDLFCSRLFAMVILCFRIVVGETVLELRCSRPVPHTLSRLLPAVECLEYRALVK